MILSDEELIEYSKTNEDGSLRKARIYAEEACRERGQPVPPNIDEHLKIPAAHYLVLSKSEWRPPRIVELSAYMASGRGDDRVFEVDLAFEILHSDAMGISYVLEKGVKVVLFDIDGKSPSEPSILAEAENAEEILRIFNQRGGPHLRLVPKP